MKRLAHKVGILVFLGLASTLSTYSQDFRNAQEALSALDKMGECKCDTDVKVYKYFNAHKDESIPEIISFASAHPHRIWVAIRAFSQIKDDRVLYFLMDLLTRAFRKEDNDPETYELHSSTMQLIRTLGDYGDNRAAPLVKDSLVGLGTDDRYIGEEALCKLNALTIAELFELHSGSKDEMLKIATSNEYSAPIFSLRVFDWIINKFSNDADVLYQSHVGKVTAFITLEDYASVLKECDIIKTSYPDLTKDLWFSIGHMGSRIDELVKFAKGKVGKSKE